TDTSADSVPVAAAVSGAEDTDSGPSHPADDPDEVMPPMTEEEAELVKAARYAQIEGDLKVAVVKQEQAM
ncbi:hypothetical protein, partial [Akkermansia muciniphila]|uniref:hypothetical protein n=1 Tax=Akkermansia muciniphila TaxID=239935 RepID=UPI00210C31B8